MNFYHFLNKLFFCFLFVPAYLVSAVVDGIYVEGIDYSGKSSVCAELRKIFANKNARVTHGFLCKNSMINFLLNKATADELSPDNCYYYALAEVIDFQFFRPDPQVFYIQDRYWIAHDSFLRFFHPDVQLGMENYVFENHPIFKYNIYLTASYETINKRYKARKKRSIHDALVVEDENVCVRFNEFCISRLPKDENWKIINTDNLTIDQVVQLIVDFVHLNS